MKRVLFVINTLGHAGAEVAMLELFRRMQDKSIHISLYVLTDQGELINRIPENVHVLNNSYCDSSVLSKEGRGHLKKKVVKSAFSHGAVFKNIPYLVANAFRMVKAKRIQPDKLLWRVLSDGGQVINEEYDLAVSFLEGGSAYFVSDHVKAKKKAAFIHIDYESAGYTRKLDKDCYLKFDKIFTVSEETKDHFMDAYPECSDFTFAFHNILDEERIVNLSKENGGFEDSYEGYRVLTVGRLVYQKGYDIVIEAMKLIKAVGYRIRWYVLGEGDLHQELEGLIEKAGLKEDFILLGAKENPYPYFAQADLYAHLTRFEGKSIAIQEAQVLGKPIIASDCSGNREQIVNGEDGILCELSPEKIKDAIIYLYENKETAMQFGKAALGKQIAYEKDLDMLLELLD